MAEKEKNIWKTRARSALAGAGVATTVIYGPVAGRAFLHWGATRAQNGAFSEARRDMSRVSKVELSVTGEQSVQRGNESFNTGGNPPNPNNAVGTSEHARGKFIESGAPQDVVNPEIDRIEAKIKDHKDPDYKDAKGEIVALDTALDSYHTSLRKNSASQFWSGAKNAGKASLPWDALAAAEGIGAYTGHKKRKEQEASVRRTVATTPPSMRELPRVTGLPYNR